MARQNRDVEQLHSEGRGLFEPDDFVEELFDECKGESKSGLSIAYGDKKAKYGDWLWLPKKLIASGEIKVIELSNGFCVMMPKWFAERNGLV